MVPAELEPDARPPAIFQSEFLRRSRSLRVHALRITAFLLHASRAAIVRASRSRCCCSADAVTCIVDLAGHSRSFRPRCSALRRPYAPGRPSRLVPKTAALLQLWRRTGSVGGVLAPTHPGDRPCAVIHAMADAAPQFQITSLQLGCQLKHDWTPQNTAGTDILWRTAWIFISSVDAPYRCQSR